MKPRLLLALLCHAALWAAGPGSDAVPVFFVANHGQAPPDVRFTAQGSGIHAFFSLVEVRYQTPDASLYMQFDGAGREVRMEGAEPLPGHANFLLGGAESWHAGIPLYGAVVYRDLYPGIDMRYGANGRNLKSEFTVAPGADPARIRIRYVGADAVKLAEDGSLEITLQGQVLTEQPPEIYQQVDGRRVSVPGSFTVANATVGFIVSGYDAAQPLIIDPVLSYSTLLGGSNSDAAMSLAVDAAGAAYVAGFTASRDFPTANAAQNANAGSNDIFVAKLNAAGNGLVYCTYLGGSGDDRAYGIAVDASGAAWVTGSTASGNFPVRLALQSKLAGGRNAFVLKLNAAGNALLFSTYLGGNASDTANGIALDGSGNAYVTGDTTSVNFPTTGLQTSKRAGQDAFVTKVSADGSRLIYSTYLGGSSDDHGAAIAVDAGGSAYVTGST